MVLVWTNAEGHEESQEHSPPGFFGVTPPHMELQAVIEALRLVDRRSPIIARELYSRIRIYCDASYVVDPRDNEGKLVRADDGFHLNVTGAQILALDVQKKIEDDLRARGAQL